MKRKDSLRVIDANLNRAREALRVLEECARFGRGDAAFGKIRALRHRLAEVESRMGLTPAALADARDSASDPGRALPAMPHASLSALVAANCRRIEEAMRAVEEFGRLVSADCAAASHARFEAYEIGKELLPGLHSRSMLEKARLCVILDGSGPEEAVAGKAAACARGGAGMLLLESLPATDSLSIRLCGRLASSSSAAGALFVVTRRADLAALSGAHGLFLRAGDAMPGPARAIVGWDSVIGVSAEARSQAPDDASDFVIRGTKDVIEPHAAAAEAVFAACDGGFDSALKLARSGLGRIAVFERGCDCGDWESAVAGLIAELPGLE